MISAQSAINIGKGLETGSSLADIFEEIPIGGPVGEAIEKLLAAAADVYGPLLITAGELTRASANKAGYRGTPELAIVIPTVLGFIPTAVWPIPTGYAPSRYTPPSSQSLCDQALRALG